jgi:hypothetical protein
MCLLSIISFLLVPTDSITWHISPGWEQESSESWVLDAPSAGVYRIYGCVSEPFEKITLDMRWRQDLSGSNNNNSRIFITDSEPSAILGELPESSIVFSVGENGSEDPLIVSNLSFGLHSEITSSFFDFAEPFDLDVSINMSILESSISVNAGSHNEGWGIPIISDLNIATDSIIDAWQPRCFGFEGVCTTSNTDAFSWALHNLDTTDVAVQRPELLSHKAVDSTMVELVWSEPLASNIASNNLAFTTSSSSPHIGFFTLSTPLIDGVLKEVKLEILEIDTIIQVVFTRPNSAKNRDLVITELFVDATPSIGYPEVEWFEILNRSKKYVNVNWWSVAASNSTMNVEAGDIIPRNGWDGMLAPNERFIISTIPFDSCLFIPNPELQAEVDGLSSLNDNGMSLSLMRSDGTLIDQVIYDRTWWGDLPLAARSTSKIYTPGCGLSSNWTPTLDSTGATPWQTGEHEVSSTCLTSNLPFEIALHLISENMIEVVFSQDIDPLCEVTATIENSTEYLYCENSSWFVYLNPDVQIHEAIDIQFNGLRLCTCDTTFSYNLNSWIPALPPNWGDLKITGFLTNPSTNSGLYEWVSIVNTSPHPIDLFTLEINSNSLINEPIIDPDEILMISSLNTVSWSSLSEKSGEIEIKSHGNVIDLVEYSWCMHIDKEKAEGGYPYQRISNLEPSNSNENWTTDLGDDVFIEYPSNTKQNTILFGLFEGRVAWHSPYSMDSLVLNSENWSPAIDWEFYGAGRNTAISKLPLPSYKDTSHITLSCDEWKRARRNAIPEEKSFVIPVNIEEYGDVYLNEVLSDPVNRGGEFIEIIMGNATETSSLTPSISSTFGLAITSSENPTPNDFIQLSEIDWLFPSSGIIAFSECPSWVMNREANTVILELELPSLQHGRELMLAKVDDEITELEKIEIIKLPEGLSSERIDVNEEVWAKSPYSKGGSSPGYENFATQINNDNVNGEVGTLDIFPKTINLNLNSDQTWVQISFELDNDIEQVDFTSSIYIYNLRGEEVVRLAEREFIHQRGVWLWEGLDANNVYVPPGTYVLIMQTEYLSKKLINRDLIQVGYY